MNPELLAMLGGGASGFVMKLIGSQMQHQAAMFERMLGKQAAADESAAKAAERGGVWVRRGIVFITFFAIVVAPFVLAFTGQGVSVARETPGFLGFFSTVKWETIQGFVVLPEIRQTALAIVGFYFGSSQIK